MQLAAKKSFVIYGRRGDAQRRLLCNSSPRDLSPHERAAASSLTNFRVENTDEPDDTDDEQHDANCATHSDESDNQRQIVASLAAKRTRVCV